MLGEHSLKARAARNFWRRFCVYCANAEPRRQTAAYGRNVRRGDFYRNSIFSTVKFNRNSCGILADYWIFRLYSPKITPLKEAAFPGEGQNARRFPLF
jgi:hypothetical protein